MKPIPSLVRPWLATICAALAMAATAAGDVTLTATSSTGSTPVAPGGTFSVTLNWAGTPLIGATDYAITLNTNQIEFTGRTFNSSIGTYADHLYLPSVPVATNRIDLTWFKAGGYLGNDVTLNFRVPATYTGPATVTVGVQVGAVQDASARAIPATATGVNVNVASTTVASSASLSGPTPITANWLSGTNALAWSAGQPGVSGNPDQATLNLTSTSTSGDFGVDLNQNLTLNQLTVNMSGTVNYRIGTGVRRTLTWVARSGQPALFEFIRISGTPLRNSFDGNSVLNTNLTVRMAHQGAKDSYFGGIVSGSGKLTLDYYHSINGSTGGWLRVGTAGDAPSTHTGGTRLMMSTSDLATTNYRFLAGKAEAFGSGPLELSKARLDLNAFNQTVGGLADGSNASSITDLSTSTLNGSTTTLTLNFASSAGTRSFAGQLADGGTRKLALAKAGSGTQVLSGAHTYTGVTTVTGGRLVVNGSLAAGSTTSVAAGATLAGNGSVTGPVNNSGTLAPGETLGTLTTGAVTMAAGARLEIQVGNWTGTAGSGWDILQAAGMSLAGTTSQPVVVKLSPLSLANFSESAKTLTLATSATAISGFSITSVTLDTTGMPGTGTWALQLDGTSRNLLAVYTPANTGSIATGSDSGTAPRTASWTTGTNLISWTGGIPGTTSSPDQVTLNLTTPSLVGDYLVDLNQNLTLNRLSVNMSGTVNFRVGTGTRRTVTWVARGAETALLEFLRVGLLPLRNSFDANSILNTNLAVRLAHQGSKDSYFGGITSGPGKLTIDYYDSVNGGSGGHLRIGTAGDTPSTHTGGTRLVVTAADMPPANYRFWPAKVDAFGTGPLELNKARLDLNAFNQSLGGLDDGANGSLITDLSTSTLNSSTTTLSLNFASSAGTRSFAGQLTDGPTRKLAITKLGTGTQVLTNTHTYTGPTTISNGRLTVNGTLAAGTATSVQAGATLAGNGTLGGPLNNLGTLAPGDSLGILNAAAVTMGAAARLEIQVANWTSTTPGSGWDQLACSALTLSGTSTQPIVIKLNPLNLTNFTESSKVLVIATSATPISGFSATTVTVDRSAMPGTGSWSVQLDGTLRNLQLVYTPAVTPLAQSVALAPGSTTTPVAGPSGADEPTGLAGGGSGVRGAGSGAGGGVVAASRIGGKSKGGKHLANLTFTIVVPRGTEFSAADGAQVSDPVDAQVFRVEASADHLVWDAEVSDLGASNQPPAGSDLPNLTGTAWEYHSFSAFEGSSKRGFIRALVTEP